MATMGVCDGLALSHVHIDLLWGRGKHTHIERLFSPEASTTHFGLFPHQVECCDQLLGRGRGSATAAAEIYFFFQQGRNIGV